MKDILGTSAVMLIFAVLALFKNKIAGNKVKELGNELKTEKNKAADVTKDNEIKEATDDHDDAVASTNASWIEKWLRSTGSK